MSISEIGPVAVIRAEKIVVCECPKLREYSLKDVSAVLERDIAQQYNLSRDTVSRNISRIRVLKEVIALDSSYPPSNPDSSTMVNKLVGDDGKFLFLLEMEPTSPAIGLEKVKVEKIKSEAKEEESKLSREVENIKNELRQEVEAKEQEAKAREIKLTQELEKETKRARRAERFLSEEWEEQRRYYRLNDYDSRVLASSRTDQIIRLTQARLDTELREALRDPDAQGAPYPESTFWHRFCTPSSSPEHVEAKVTKAKEALQGKSTAIDDLIKSGAFSKLMWVSPPIFWDGREYGPVAYPCSDQISEEHAELLRTAVDIGVDKEDEKKKLMACITYLRSPSIPAQENAYRYIQDTYVQETKQLNTTEHLKGFELDLVNIKSELILREGKEKESKVTQEVENMKRELEKEIKRARKAEQYLSDEWDDQRRYYCLGDHASKVLASSRTSQLIRLTQGRLDAQLREAMRDPDTQNAPAPDSSFWHRFCTSSRNPKDVKAKVTEATKALQGKSTAIDNLLKSGALSELVWATHPQHWDQRRYGPVAHPCSDPISEEHAELLRTAVEVVIDDEAKKKKYMACITYLRSPSILPSPSS